MYELQVSSLQFVPTGAIFFSRCYSSYFGRRSLQTPAVPFINQIRLCLEMGKAKQRHMVGIEQVFNDKLALLVDTSTDVRSLNTKKCPEKSKYSPECPVFAGLH